MFHHDPMRSDREIEELYDEVAAIVRDDQEPPLIAREGLEVTGSRLEHSRPRAYALRMPFCTECGTKNPDQAKFCFSCGAALAQAPPPAAPSEERKVITAIFVDLVGSTARSESLDPEDVKALGAPYHARVRAALAGHGGTFEKFSGDAVLALV